MNNQNDCKVNPASSRYCSNGAMGCTVKHFKNNQLIMETPMESLDFLDIPSEVYKAAQTVDLFFRKKGFEQWEFLNIASRQLVTHLKSQLEESKAECEALAHDFESMHNATVDLTKQCYSVNTEMLKLKDVATNLGDRLATTKDHFQKLQTEIDLTVQQKEIIEEENNQLRQEAIALRTAWHNAIDREKLLGEALEKILVSCGSFNESPVGPATIAEIARTTISKVNRGIDL